jgi:hypothetical protein
MITQEFAVEIVRVNETGLETRVFPELGSAFTSWEREFAEPEDDDDEEDSNGFLVGAGDSDEDLPESEDDEDADEGESFEGAEPDGELVVTAKLNSKVLEQFRDMTSSKADYKIRFIYGNETVGVFIREFLVDNNAIISMGSGVKSKDELEVHMYFDIYGNDYKY